MVMEFNTTTGFYPKPYSLPSLSQHIRAGLVVIGCLATISLLTTFTAICFIVQRMLSWRLNPKHYVTLNPCVVLVLNLLVADFLQSSALVISFHWIQEGGIFAPTGWCWVQGGLLHVGDLASGFFVLGIAFHTLFTVATGKRLAYGWLVSAVLGVWVAAVVLTIFGPLRFGSRFFTRAGNWCWISQEYDADRLWLHYLWIFIDEFGTTAIYFGLFVYFIKHLHVFHTASTGRPTSSKVTQAARYMCLYPTIYVSLTLPLAVCRMIALSGHTPSDTSLLFAGALITSCGWTDAAVYTITRRVLVNDQDGVAKVRPKALGKEHILKRHTGADINMRRYGNFTTTSGGDEEYLAVSEMLERFSPDIDRIATPKSKADAQPTSRSASDVGLGLVTVETTISVYPSPADDTLTPEHPLQRLVSPRLLWTPRP